MSKVTLAVATALIFLLGGITITIVLARGYRPDFNARTLLPTGILVATSDPDGAEVYIDGKLKTATNNTINLPPDRYRVKISKEGYYPWEKEVNIAKEEVVKTNAWLFPTLPDLRPLTVSGALNPVVSPDGTRVAYGVASSSARINGNGIWVIDMSRLFPPTPISAGSDFKQIYRNTPQLLLSGSNLSWSADGRQLLASSSGSIFLLDSDRLNDSPTEVTNRLPLLLSEYESFNKSRLANLRGKLAKAVDQTLATAAANLVFSPDETKALYQATAAASLPTYLTTYLPGANPTPQDRDLKPGGTYAYDLKEDRNYLIENCHCLWFPSSRHLLEIETGRIWVREYDGTNRQTIYSGQFKPGSVFAWPNWSKIVILTTLGSADGKQENLYTVNLR